MLARKANHDISLRQTLRDQEIHPNQPLANSVAKRQQSNRDSQEMGQRTPTGFELLDLADPSRRHRNNPTGQKQGRNRNAHGQESGLLENHHRQYPRCNLDARSTTNRHPPKNDDGEFQKATARDAVGMVFRICLSCTAILLACATMLTMTLLSIRNIDRPP